MGKHGGHHGGSWKVAYADFVTSMMALFLVLWLVSADQEIREAVQGYFRGELKRPQGGGLLKHDQTGPKDFRSKEFSSKELLAVQDLQRAAERLETVLNNSPEMGDDMIRFQFLADGVRIIALDRSRKPFFEPGTASLTPFGNWVLKTIAWEIDRYPFLVEVEGHIQKGVEGGQSTEWDLSTQRAVNAKTALNQGGINENRFWRVVGYADRIPIRPEDPANEENRRISIVVRPGSERDLYDFMDKGQRSSMQ
jgi:chemotaxis protein MotB